LTHDTSRRRLPRARQEHLLREIELRGSIRAADIAVQLGVTEVTVRRDIIELEKAGRLARVHGGAISLSGKGAPVPARALVGLVLPGAVSHFPDVVRGAEAASPALHARVVLAQSNYLVDTEERHLRRLVELGVEGLILAPTLRGRSLDQLAAALQRLPVPTVLVERRLEQSSLLAHYDQVRTEHARGAEIAVEHLAQLGHSSVGLAMLDRTPTAPAVREGYLRAQEDLGLSPAPVASLPKGDDDPEASDAALKEFLDACLASGTRAALIHTDAYASRLIEIAMDLGVRVPEDFSIVAYDDENAELAIVPLTAVAPPGRELGRLAMTTLFERLRGDSPDGLSPRHIGLVPRLTIRKSSGPPPE